MFPAFILRATLGVLVTAVVCQEDPHLMILVADLGTPNFPGAIYKLYIHHMKLTTLNIPNVVKPVDIDVDKQRNHFYWTDINTNQIRRADIDGGNDVTVATLNSTSSPEGLTLDGNTRQVFYTDQGNDIIVRIQMSTFQSTVIVNTGLDKPRGIVADTTNRKLYWADWGKVSKIETSDYDGNQKRTIVSSGLSGPSGITLDQGAGRLFWTNASGFIESALVDGTDRKRLWTRPGMKYNGITVFNNFLYFTILKDRAVYTLTETGNHQSSLKSQRLQDPTGISVFSPNTNITVSCPYGQFGPSCTKCGVCTEGSPCEKTTGICFGGCAPGYKREKCTEGCDPGTFGKECNSTCSSNCNCICDAVTGNCPNGCQTRCTGVNCTTWCPLNTYGDQCIPCGKCAGGTPCDSLSGYCYNGCQPGWIGFRCDLEVETSTMGNLQTMTDSSTEVETGEGMAEDKGPPITTIVGPVVGVTVFIIVVVVVVAVVIVRRQTRPRDEPYAVFSNGNKEDSSYATIGNINTVATQSGHHRQCDTLAGVYS